MKLLEMFHRASFTILDPSQEFFSWRSGLTYLRFSVPTMECINTQNYPESEKHTTSPNKDRQKTRALRSISNVNVFAK